MAREYYSVPEAAAMLGLSRIAVFKRVKSGRIAALRIGRNWAIPASLLPVREGVSVDAHAVGQAPKVQDQVEQTVSNDAAMDSMGWD